MYEIQLPTGTSAEIYYNGLYTLPIYKDWIIAHTSIADDGIFREDNRLCAVNIKNKQIDWYFPNITNERSYCAFDGKGYLYKNKLVFRYIKDFNEKSESDRTTVCLNLDTNEILWEVTEDRDLSQDGRSLGNGANVVGLEDKCFFVQNEKELYCFDIEESSVKSIYAYNLDEQFIHSIILSENTKYLILFCYDFQRDGDDYSYKNSIHILDSQSFDEIYVRPIFPPVESYNNHLAATGYEKNNILYVNIDTFLTAIDWKQDIQLWAREDYWVHTKMDMSVFDNTLMKCGGNATVGYDIHTGDIIFDYRNHGSQYTTFDGPYAYMVTAGAKLEIIERASGRILETITSPGNNQANGGFYGSYPCIYGDKMYIMGDRNKLYCYPKYPW